MIGFLPHAEAQQPLRQEALPPFSPEFLPPAPAEAAEEPQAEDPPPFSAGFAPHYEASEQPQDEALPPFSPDYPAHDEASEPPQDEALPAFSPDYPPHAEASEPPQDEALPAFSPDYPSHAEPSEPPQDEVLPPFAPSDYQPQRTVSTRSSRHVPVARRPRRRGWRVLLVMLLLAAGGGVAAKRWWAARTTGRAPVEMAVVTRGTLNIKILETGKVQAVQQAQIRSRVAGVITEVPVKEGQNVRAGDVLLRLDPSDFQREVARVAADLEEKQAVVTLAEWRKRNAAQGFRAGVVPRVELESVINDLALARARLKASLVSQRTARDQVRYTTVLAPFAGRIIGRNVHPGEVVTAGMTATVEGRPLLVLAKTNDLSVRTDLNQIDFARVRLGQRARITLDLLPGKEFAGQVVSRAASSSPGASGTEVLPIEIRLTHTEDLTAVTPGMTADVEIQLAQKKDVLLLPIEAVSSDSGKKTVSLWSEANQRFEVRAVQTGDSDDRQIEITGGLAEGARVQLGAAAPPKAGE